MLPFRRPFSARLLLAGCAAAAVLTSTGAAAAAAPQSAAPAKAKFQVLYNFSGGADGWLPNGPLVKDPAGILYGTTYYGGATAGYCYPNGCGVVFKFDPSTGTQTVLHTFTSGTTDGSQPRSSLIGDDAGNLYGTTSGGGPADSGGVFKLDPAGNETVLYFFCQLSGCSDGQGPNGALLMDEGGNIYGTTIEGGIRTGNCAPYGCGVIFRVDTQGHEQAIPFDGSDGKQPYDAPLLAYKHALYGTTTYGGDTSSQCGGANYGCGVMFRATPNGRIKVLHQFADGPDDGGFPTAGLVRDHAGTLYGTTSAGGSSNNGVVFKIDPTGSETVLYNFVGPPHDGRNPGGGVVLDSAGTLHGTTEAGGPYDWGTVFTLDSAGSEKVVHKFQKSDGAVPVGSLILGPHKTYYGVTNQGGAGADAGTIFVIP